MASCCPGLRFQQRTPLPNRMLLRRWLRFPATLPRPWNCWQESHKVGSGVGWPAQGGELTLGTPQGLGPQLAVVPLVDDPRLSPAPQLPAPPGEKLPK